VVVEGAELLATALAAGAQVESVYVAPEGRTADGPVDAAFTKGARVFDLAPGVIERVADTVHPQPVISIVSFSVSEMGALEAANTRALVVVCAEVRDPGNAGTVIRTADAVGASAVAFADDTVDPTNPKTIRASAGSIFHLPVIEGGPVVDLIRRLREGGYTTVGTLAREGRPYTDFDWCQPVAIVLGNEAAGLTGEVVDALDATVTVPLDGRAESLNVSTAAAVVCFEARRQRVAADTEPSGSKGTGVGRPTMPGMEATAAGTVPVMGRTDG
jgi:RNA methyltransferase, TrmH family